MWYFRPLPPLFTLYQDNSLPLKNAITKSPLPLQGTTTWLILLSHFIHNITALLLYVVAKYEIWDSYVLPQKVSFPLPPPVAWRHLWMFYRNTMCGSMYLIMWAFMKCEYPFYSEFLLAIKLFIFTHLSVFLLFKAWARPQSGVSNANPLICYVPDCVLAYI